MENVANPGSTLGEAVKAWQSLSDEQMSRIAQTLLQEIEPELRQALKITLNPAKLKRLGDFIRQLDRNHAVNGTVSVATAFMPQVSINLSLWRCA